MSGGQGPLVWGVARRDDIIHPAGKFWVVRGTRNNPKRRAIALEHGDGGARCTIYRSLPETSWCKVNGIPGAVWDWHAVPAFPLPDLRGVGDQFKSFEV